MNYLIRDAYGRFTDRAMKVILEMADEGLIQSFITIDGVSLPGKIERSRETGLSKDRPFVIDGRRYTERLYWDKDNVSSNLDIVDIDDDAKKVFNTRFEWELQKEYGKSHMIAKSYVDIQGCCYIGDSYGYLCIYDPRNRAYGQRLPFNRQWQRIPLDMALKLFVKQKEGLQSRLIAAIQDWDGKGELQLSNGSRIQNPTVELNHNEYTPYPYLINGVSYTRYLMNPRGAFITRIVNTQGTLTAKHSKPKIYKSKVTGVVVLFTSDATGVQLSGICNDGRYSNEYISCNDTLQWQKLKVKEAVKLIKEEIQ